MMLTTQLNNNLGYQVRTYNPDIQYIRNYKTYNQTVKMPKISKDLYEHSIEFKMLSHDGVQQGGGQRGSGVFADAIKLLTDGVKVGSELYSGEIATDIKNAYGKWMNPNNNWRPDFIGEKHMIDPSTGVTYNYLGPGTHVNERVARGDPPLDGPAGLDAVAMVHDIEYRDATSAGDVRKADKKFISGIEKARGNRTAKFLAKNAIRAKMKMEDMGIAKAQDFTTLPNIVQDDKPNAMKIDDDKPSFAGKGIKDPAKKLKDKVKRMKMDKIRKLIKKL